MNTRSLNSICWLSIILVVKAKNKTLSHELLIAKVASAELGIHRSEKLRCLRSTIHATIRKYQKGEGQVAK